MKTQRASILFAVLAALFLISGHQAPGQEKKKEPKGLLDGMTFTGTSVEKGKTATEPDTIKFKKGKFHSRGCDSWGFDKAVYSASKAGESIAFQATTVSPREGRMVWEGTVQDGTCEVKYTWTKEGQKPIDYVFTGTLKEKKEKKK